MVARLSRFAHLRAALERTNKVAAIALAVFVCLFWAQYLRPQAFGGSAAYVLVSGKSMLPRYHTGDVVLVLRHSSYRVGQVIAYRVPKGDPMAGAQVIHRIIGGDAKRGFVVQGDNRTQPDVWRPTALRCRWGQDASDPQCDRHPPVPSLTDLPRAPGGLLRVRACAEPSRQRRAAGFRCVDCAAPSCFSAATS